MVGELYELVYWVQVKRRGATSGVGGTETSSIKEKDLVGVGEEIDHEFSLKWRRSLEVTRRVNLRGEGVWVPGDVKDNFKTQKLSFTKTLVKVRAVERF